MINKYYKNHFIYQPSEQHDEKIVAVQFRDNPQSLDANH